MAQRLLGAMYWAVPITMPVWVTGAASTALAIPKSVSFTWPGRRDEDVAGLDVAVHQPGGVRDLQGAAGLLEHVQRVPQREPAGALEDRVQRFTVDQFHHQVRGAALAVHLGFAVVVHAGDARVVEHRDGAGLGAESFDELRVGGVLRLEHLDGDAATQRESMPSHTWPMPPVAMRRCSR